MKRPACLLFLLCASLQLTATPLTIKHTIKTNNGNIQTIIAKTEYARGYNIGVAFVCKNRVPEIILHFGGFPGEHHPVQLYLKHRNKRTVFSNAYRGSRYAGFHSPKITAPPDIRKFLDQAFLPNALITNNYRGFYLALPDKGKAIKTLITNC